MIPYSEEKYGPFFSRKMCLLELFFYTCNCIHYLVVSSSWRRMISKKSIPGLGFLQTKLEEDYRNNRWTHYRVSGSFSHFVRYLDFFFELCFLSFGKAWRNRSQWLVILTRMSITLFCDCFCSIAEDKFWNWGLKFSLVIGSNLGYGVTAGFLSHLSAFLQLRFSFNLIFFLKSRVLNISFLPILNKD